MTDLERKLQERLDEIMEDYEKSLACQKKFLETIAKSNEKIVDLESQLLHVMQPEEDTYTCVKSFQFFNVSFCWTCIRCWFLYCKKRAHPD